MADGGDKDGGGDDPRIEMLQNYCIKTLKQVNLKINKQKMRVWIGTVTATVEAKVQMSLSFKSSPSPLLFHFQKPDKWGKMMSQEDNMVVILEFLEKGENRVLVIFTNQQGQLQPITTFPPSTKNKVCIIISHTMLCYITQCKLY